MDTQLLDAGEYAPTLAGVTNIDAVTAPSEFFWVRVGFMVIVAGRVDVDPTAAGPTATAFTVSLPLPTTFATANDASGSINATGTASESGGVTTTVGAGTVNVNYLALSVANHGMRLFFMYRMR